MRQLQNVIRNIVVLNDGEQVTADMLPAPLDQLVGTVQPLPAGAPSETVAVSVVEGGNVPSAGGGLSGVALPKRVEDIRPLEETERDIIEHAIALCGDNVPKAAAHLGISASTIYRKRQGWEGSA